VTWRPADVATLRAVAETFVPGSGARTTDLVAEALVRAADPAQVRQLRLVLRALEMPLVNRALGASARPFSAMDARGREQALLGWAASRIPQRRAAFNSLRKLITFVAYADPGPEGDPNPRLRAIDYVPDRPPVAVEPTPIVPERLPFDRGDPDEPMDLDADVVVVGSGAGAGVIAAALAAHGRSVLVLEAGPLVSEATMPREELDAFGRLYLNHGLLATWDGSVTLLAGSGVGGGTLVNWMTTIAPPASVREEWRRGHGIEDLGDAEAWGTEAAAIEAELGVTETAAIPPKDQAILRGATALGWEAAPIRRNGAGCDDCGSCGFGCPRGTKRSGIRVHLAAAHRDGARIVPRLRVTRVLLREGRAVGVEGLAVVPDAQTGEAIPDPAAPGGVRVRRVRVHAPQVVLAAGALRTPAILQASGLGHPAIGRYLRIHPVTGVLARMPDPVELWRGPMQGARSAQFVESEPGRAGYVLESAPAHPGLLALATPWEGAAAHETILRDARWLTTVLAVTRDGGEGRTTLTRAGRVRIDYRLDGTGVMTLRHALGSAARLAAAAGAQDILAPATQPLWFRPTGRASEGGPAWERFLAGCAGFDFGPNRGTVFSAHQMGSVRMGADPATHPCDPAGRVRVDGRGDAVIPGLYVGDASLFPTGLGVNPMLTVMVLARRVARTVIAESGPR
jgi:choline dehydrogenase-like flavoprotein